MSFNNKQYNTRFSGRYNTTGQFVPAGEAEWRQLVSRAAPGGGFTPRLVPPFAQRTIVKSFGQSPPSAPKQSPQDLQSILEPSPEDVKMETDISQSLKSSMSEAGSTRPHWMKTRLPGVKKISNKERRRRQNENLRRLLTPKNALMVLNEMMPNEQVTNQQFKVEPAANAQYNAYKPPNTQTFCADLTIEGNIYKGYGDNKLMARNAAAEQAIRDLIIKKMSKVVSDSGSTNGNDTPDEEALPMIQLASFALHKLFTEWEYEGHKVPQLKPNTLSEPALEPVKKEKELPSSAGSMHPCMLLTYMRPHLEYRELAVEGDRPQNMIFTMAVDVDDSTYIGKASNKKEARKMAAKAACTAIFKVTFEPAVTGIACQSN